MDEINKNQDKKGFLDKVKENTEDELQILGTFVRLGVVIWSGFIITLNYVDLPMIKKGQSGGDITFVASVFTGALATFGLTTSNSKASSKLPESKKKKNEEATTSAVYCSTCFCSISNTSVYPGQYVFNDYYFN